MRECSNYLEYPVQIDVNFTDFTKAFDRGDYVIILFKLSKFGVFEGIVDFFDPSCATESNM